MRSTSRVLGIIGAAISMLYGLFLITGGAAFLNSGVWSQLYDSSGGLNGVIPKSEYIQQTAAAGAVFLGFGAASIAVGILGLVGGILVKRKHVASGVMLIIAAVGSLFTFFNLVSMTLYIISAVMALKREPQIAAAAYPPYPPPYYPYPQQFPPYPPPYPQCWRRFSGAEARPYRARRAGQRKPDVLGSIPFRNPK